ncbi:CpaF family protein [soil metagenome]
MSRLLELVYDRTDLADLDPAERRLELRRLLAAAVEPDELPQTVAAIADSIDGYGPLTELMRDATVTDVLVNGPSEVWVERAGRLERTQGSFASREELEAFTDRLLARAGARADAAKPVADALLPDGSRLSVVLPPVGRAGPLLSFRCFPRTPLTLTDLTSLGMLSPGHAGQLADCVKRRVAIVLSGGTGTGKTTLANALLGHVPPDERVVIIEETPELRPACAHWVSLAARSENIEGAGRVELADLVRTALRMRPDRIVVGEVRGPEALVALSALATGHEGSILTVHARSAGDALERLVTLALGASTGVSEGVLRDEARRAFGLVVHLGRDGGRRMVDEILAVT